MSLTREDLEDIKQIVTVAVRSEVREQIGEVREQIGELHEYVDKRFEEMDKRFDEMDQRINNMSHVTQKRFDSIEAKQDEILNAFGGDIADHERRITRLEKAAA